MKSSSSNLKERELQQMQVKERQLHSQCMAWFKELKIHLETLHNNRFSVVETKDPYEIAFRILFREEFMELFHSKEVNASDFQNKCWQKDFKDYTRCELKTYRQIEVQAIQEIENQIKEREIQQKESLVTEGTTLEANLSTDGTPLDTSSVTEGTTLEACLVTEGATLEACLVTEGATLEACLVTKGIALDDNLVAKESTDDSVTSSEQLDERRSSRNECNRSGNENRSSDNESISSRNDADADIGPSYDSDTMSEVHHDIFENMFVHGIQNNEQPESILDTYVVNENNRSIISDIPNMDPDRDKEEQDYIDHEQQCTFFASLINNLNVMSKNVIRLIVKLNHSEEELKCEAEKCLKVKQRKSLLSYHGFVYGETQFVEPPKVPLKRRDVNLKKHLEQAQLINYDPKLWKSLPMKYFCYVKQVMLKFEKEYVSKQNPPRENVFINMSFEDNVKRIARNRLSEEFKPLVKDVNLQLKYFEKGLVKEIKDDLKYVTSLEDEFDETCLILDVQQEFFKTQLESVKSESHSHVYENDIFKQNSSLKNENLCLKKIITALSKQAADVKEEMTKRYAQYENDFAKLEAHCISFEHKSLKKSSTSVQNGHVLSNKSDEAKIKFDIKDLETINIELKYSVASLLKENEHLKMIYQNLLDTIIRSRVQTKSSNVSQNEAKNLKSQLSEFADIKFDKFFQKIESIKKKKFDSRISNDFLQKYLYDIDPSSVES
ncbi:hypothetical protein Tco_1203506 [Tanacetum coccineum]